MKTRSCPIRSRISMSSSRRRPKWSSSTSRGRSPCCSASSRSAITEPDVLWISSSLPVWWAPIRAARPGMYWWRPKKNYRIFLMNSASSEPTSIQSNVSERVVFKRFFTRAHGAADIFKHNLKQAHGVAGIFKRNLKHVHGVAGIFKRNLKHVHGVEDIFKRYFNYSHLSEGLFRRSHVNVTLSALLLPALTLLAGMGTTAEAGAVAATAGVQTEVVQTETPRFDRLRETIESGSIFRATFSHEYRDSYTGEETRTLGEIWIGSDRYRVESDGQTMVVDDEISRVYDSRRNRLLISAYEEEEDDFAPSRMLQGVDNTYRVEEREVDRGTLVTLISEDPFSIFMQVEILLNRHGEPVEIEAVDQAENLLITRFDEGSFMEATTSLFELQVPESAERIDLRHE